MKKQLTKTQQMAFQHFRNIYQQAQQQFINIANIIAEEHNIPQEEFSQWKISQDGQWLEKIDKTESEKEK